LRLVGFYDIQRGNGEALFFQSRSPHGVQKLSISVNVVLMQPSFVINLCNISNCGFVESALYKLVQSVFKSLATLFFNIYHYFCFFLSTDLLLKDQTRLCHVPEGFSNKNLSE